jgi:hypothetical protein
MGDSTKVLWMSITVLELQAWTDTVTNGGGFGIEGAAEGILGAGVLNALAAERHEYAFLCAFVHMPDGSRKDLVFGFRDATESDLRQRLAAAIPAWAEEYVEQWIPKLAASEGSDDIVNDTYSLIDKMRTRGMLTDEQHARLESELSKKGPRPVPPPESRGAENRVAQLKTLAELRDSGALTEAEFQAEKSLLLRSF